MARKITKIKNIMEQLKELEIKRSKFIPGSKDYNKFNVRVHRKSKELEALRPLDFKTMKKLFRL